MNQQEYWAWRNVATQQDYNMVNPLLASEHQELATVPSDYYKSFSERNGFRVQKPDGVMAVVGEQLPPVEQVHGGPYLLWADIEAALSRLGMVPVARSWYHEARALMNAQRGPEPSDRMAFPANALRPLHGEKWR